jgi:uncharacterized protein (TIGR02145 family)
VSCTTYYYRAYATNSVGTAYGAEMSFTPNANAAPVATVTIGTQTWTTKNLDVTTYTDGTPIPQVADQTAWEALETGAWCYYNNDAANDCTYGKLYNWYAVAGIHDTDPNTPNKQLAPTGYHIPSDAEWTVLTDFLGGIAVAGDQMKATTLWQAYSGITNTNSSGFTGLPGGYRYGYFQSFQYLGLDGAWWSATTEVSYGLTAWYRALVYRGSHAYVDVNHLVDGFSVRCVRD